MKLKKAKRIVYSLMAAVAAALLAGTLLPDRGKGWGYFAVLVLLVVSAFACLLLLRCPHCYGQIHLWGQTYCPTCGKPIEEEDR